jgi:hypothetical protein
VAELERALEDPELRGEAIEAIRSMIGTIGVVSRAESGASLALHGRPGAASGAVLRKRKSPTSVRDGAFTLNGCGGRI